VEQFAPTRASRTTVSLLGPGESFILAAVVENATMFMSARSLGRFELLRLPAGRLRQLTKRNHQLLDAPVSGGQVHKPSVGVGGQA